MSARRPLIAGNWKLHNGLGEAVQLATAIRQEAGESPAAELVVGPVFTALSAVAKALVGSPVGVSAQDVYHEPKGAFTGEVSAPLLKDAGCTHCILGHSERRALFGETDASVRAKLGAVLEQELTPIVCVGETLEQREAGKTLDIVLSQVDGALDGLSAAQLAPLVIAYEPVWAIGTGRTASPADAQEVHGAIRGRLAELYDQGFADGVRILYGGSVKPDNARDLLAQADIDGALVGGASLKADSFMAIAAAVS